MIGATVTRDAADGPIHLAFSLSYAQYLVLNRTLLQSMPLDWQERFVECLAEMERHFANVETEPPGRYRVQLVSSEGKFLPHSWHPVPPYDRGRTKVTPLPFDREAALARLAAR